jgi:transposase
MIRAGFLDTKARRDLIELARDGTVEHRLVRWANALVALAQEWLARSDCRIKLHFIPAYCPHLNPIERLRGLMPALPELKGGHLG